MDLFHSLKHELSKGDYNSETEDEYVKILETNSKRNLLLRVGIGTIYLLLLIVSLLIV